MALNCSLPLVEVALIRAYLKIGNQPFFLSPLFTFNIGERRLFLDGD